MGNEERKEERKCTKNVGEKERKSMCCVTCVCSCDFFFTHMELFAYTMAQQDLVDHECMKREGGEREHVDMNLQGKCKFFCCMLLFFVMQTLL